jgi:hypothetical protein
MENKEDFQQYMRDLYSTILQRCGYRASYLRRMVTEHGGLAAAKMLLTKSEISSGFAELWLRGATDLTIEAIVVRSPWRSLFSAAELAIAESRLQRLA